MRQFLQLLARETEAATAVEYGLILALIFLAMIGAIQAFGVTAMSIWTTIADNVAVADEG